MTARKKTHSFSAISLLLSISVLCIYMKAILDMEEKYCAIVFKAIFMQSLLFLLTLIELYSVLTCYQIFYKFFSCFVLSILCMNFHMKYFLLTYLYSI